MTWSEITQLAGIFVVFTFIVHVYQSWMMKGNHRETMRVLEKNHEETMRVLEKNHEETMRVLEKNHEETMRVLEKNHEETMRVLDNIDKTQKYAVEIQKYIADLTVREGEKTREAIHTKF